MWANRLGHSPKMSDYEWFAQVAQRKWAIVSESLRSLTKNEQMSESLICSFLGKKRAIRSENDERNPGPEYLVLGRRHFFCISASLHPAGSLDPLWRGDVDKILRAQLLQNRFKLYQNKFNLPIPTVYSFKTGKDLHIYLFEDKAISLFLNCKVAWMQFDMRLVQDLFYTKSLCPTVWWICGQLHSCTASLNSQRRTWTAVAKLLLQLYCSDLSPSIAMLIELWWPPSEHYGYCSWIKAFVHTIICRL